MALAADMAVQTQRHRDLMKLAFAGDRSGADAQRETCGQMEAALAALQSALGERPALKLDELWRTTRRASASRTSFGAITALQRSVRHLAASDFSQSVRLRGTDEMSVVGWALEAMTDTLSKMVADIRSNSALVTQAGRRMSADSRPLSERTEARASSLEQTAANVHEMTAAVRQSADSLQVADTMARRVHSIADTGGAAIGLAVSSMQDIQTSSRRVHEIISVIEGIAFQTNILALNAAVEAARAGEQGRGFAVLAAEVRALAQRSSVLAREIKALISASVQHVDTGVLQIQTASSTLADSVNGIGEVADHMRAISASSAEQSNGLTQIAQAVNHIDEITQQNAQMAETTLHSSLGLSERAAMLACGVESFRLRQGGADEAHALVTRAVELYSAPAHPAVTANRAGSAGAGADENAARSSASPSAGRARAC